MWIFIFIVIIIVILYFIGFVIVNRVIINPSKNIYRIDQFKHEEIDINGINTQWFNNFPNSPTIFFCHGNSGNISHRSYIANICKSLECNLILFDYSGFGKSTGVSTIFNIYKKSAKIYEYYIEKISPENMIIWGESLGGYVAISLAKNYKCKKLICASTFSSFTDIIYDSSNPIAGSILICSFPLLLFMKKSSDLIKDVTVPTLIVHSKIDDVIPFASAVRLYNNCGASEKYIMEIGGGHSSPNFDKSNIDIICSFMNVKTNHKVIKNEFKNALRDIMRAF